MTLYLFRSMGGAYALTISKDGSNLPDELAVWSKTDSAPKERVIPHLSENEKHVLERDGFLLSDHPIALWGEAES